MRKTELKNCPQWLLDADTENEDVDFDAYGVIIWRSGNFRGGNFLGGDFLGGNFWGGSFRGDFRGGNFRGNFLDGSFRGGNFLGGNFRGGNFLGGNFRGEKLNHKPISIYGFEWMILITGAQMQIGCQCHSHKAWHSFTDEQIENMHPKATEFWRINKDFLLSICGHEAAVTRYIDSNNQSN